MKSVDDNDKHWVPKLIDPRRIAELMPAREGRLMRGATNLLLVLMLASILLDKSPIAVASTLFDLGELAGAMAVRLCLLFAGA